MADNKYGKFFETPFCENFRGLFNKLDPPLTYEQFGKAAGGISRQAVSKYYNGHTYPKSDNLILICKYFNVSADYILGLSDYKTQKFDWADIGKQTGLIEPILTELLETDEMLNAPTTFITPDGEIVTVKNDVRARSPLAQSLNYMYSNDDGTFFFELWKYIAKQESYRKFCDKYEEVSKLKSKSELRHMTRKERTEYKQNIIETPELKEEANAIYLNAIELYNKYQELRFETLYLKDNLKEMFNNILSNEDHPAQNRIGEFLGNLKGKREYDLYMKDTE